MAEISIWSTINTIYWLRLEKMWKVNHFLSTKTKAKRFPNFAPRWFNWFSNFRQLNRLSWHWPIGVGFSEVFVRCVCGWWRFKAIPSFTCRIYDYSVDWNSIGGHFIGTLFQTNVGGKSIMWQRPMVCCKYMINLGWKTGWLWTK